MTKNSMPPDLTLVINFLERLRNWVEDNGWAGWDPYDIWDSSIGLWMARRGDILASTANSLVSRASELFPILLRRALRAAPAVNGKAMGLFAAGFLELEASGTGAFTVNGEPGYLPCFRWLEENKVDKYGGCGWGYPFDWKSRLLIPKRTPTAVNSAIIGHAYWLKYMYHHDKQALSRCRDICSFFLQGLNRSGHKDNGSFCFSYTPIDNFQVHNANLFAAEFLIRIGTECGHEGWVRTGLAAANFSLSEIRDDGTLNYWSNEQAKSLQQDTYHSGFEIRALNNIACVTGIKEIRLAADKYLQTWLRDFFSHDGGPCLGRGETNVIEVHSCAESLLCLAKVFRAGSLPKTFFLEYVMRVLSAVGKLWVTKDGHKGYFAYKIHTRYGIALMVDIPYIRWGQAWMFYALASLLSAAKESCN